MYRDLENINPMQKKVSRVINNNNIKQYSNSFPVHHPAAQCADAFILAKNTAHNVHFLLK